MDLDAVADELYAVPPDEFVAVRKQRQEDARAAGNRTLAREIGALPKPTAAAWVCNLLVREQRAEIEGLASSATCCGRPRRVWRATSCGCWTASAPSC